MLSLLLKPGNHADRSRRRAGRLDGEQRRGRVVRLDRILVEGADEGDLSEIRQPLDDGAHVNAAVAGAME